MTTDEKADQIAEILELLASADREVIAEFMARASEITASAMDESAGLPPPR